MPKTYQFTKEEIGEMEAAAKKNKNKNVAKRLEALLLRGQGKKRTEVAAKTGFSVAHVKATQKYSRANQNGGRWLCLFRIFCTENPKAVNRLAMLYKPFAIYGDYHSWQDEAAAALSKVMRDGESGVELWYPVAKCPFETVVVFSSFLPVIFYYVH